MSFSFPKSILSSLLAHFNDPNLTLMSWSCHVWILTTVPSLQTRQINKSTPTTFFSFFVLIWNWTNDLKCELSWLCRHEIHSPLVQIVSLLYEIEAILKWSYGNTFPILRRLKNYKNVEDYVKWMVKDFFKIRPLSYWELEEQFDTTLASVH